MSGFQKQNLFSRLGKLRPVLLRILKIAALPVVAFVIGAILTLVLLMPGISSEIPPFLKSNAFFIPEIIQICILIAILSQAMLILEEGESTHEREKKKATLDYIVSVWDFYEPPRRSLELKFENVSTVPIDSMNVKDRVRAAQLFNCMNIVSLGLIKDALSEEIIDELYRGHFLVMRNKYSEFLKERPGSFPHYDVICARFAPPSNSE